jgi:magnesium transporter
MGAAAPEGVKLEISWLAGLARRLGENIPGHASGAFRVLAQQAGSKLPARTYADIPDDGVLGVNGGPSPRPLTPGADRRSGELMLFVGTDFVISVRHGPDPGLSDVRSDLEARPEILRVGPPAVLYALMDRVVDDLCEVVETVQEEVEDTEARVFAPGHEPPTERIYKLTREVLELRHALEPLVPVAAALTTGRLAAGDGIGPCFRDVQDHVVTAHDHIRGLGELLVTDLAANQARVTVQQNEDVRRISAWVAILAVCTLIVGVYGMNFSHMPELQWPLGYPLVICVMAAASLGLYMGFSRNHWL